MAEKIEFDIKVNSNGLTKAFSDATSESKKLSDTISTALGTFGGGVALKAFSALGSAISSTTDFIKESVSAAAEQEAALNKLAQSLRATGEFSKQAVDDFAQFSSQLQKTSIFGDEVVISQLAIAKSFGATNQQAKDLVQAAANLSATFGGSLDENVFKLGKTLGGVVSRELKSAIPELKALGQEALSSGAALGIINQRFSGAAASELNTYTGSTIALGNAFSDLQEEIGAFVTGSSLVGKALDSTKSIIESITQTIIDYRVESEANKKGFVDTESEINSLSSSYEALTVQIEKQQAVINKEGPNKAIISASEIQFAETQVKILSAELDKLYNQINISQEKIAAQATPIAPVKGADLTTEEINALKESEAQKTFIVAQAELERQNVIIEAANASIVNEQLRQEEELQRILEYETQKKELEFQLAEEKAALVGDSSLRQSELSRIGKERELAFTQIANKNIVDSEKLKADKLKKFNEETANFEQQTLQTRLQYIGAFGNLATSLTADGSKAQFLIQKASAIASSIVATQLAASQALAVPTAPNLGLAATAKTIGAINTASIVATAIKGFEGGGVIGATSGPDNMIAAVRTGEMVLNADQQGKLFSAINSGGLGGGDVVINIDGRE
ncbi:MAG: hypothetical protein HUM72_12455, partial [Dolichospermum sp.]|nr:hypothetical protein [Dolichospermum sp.]